jgi:hypothetical protein
MVEVTEDHSLTYPMIIKDIRAGIGLFQGQKEWCYDDIASAHPGVM